MPRNPFSRPRDWRVIAAGATTAALGLTTASVAWPSGSAPPPDTIDLVDPRPVVDRATTPVLPTPDATVSTAPPSPGAAPSSPFDEPEVVDETTPPAPVVATPEVVTVDSPAVEESTVATPTPVVEETSVDTPSAQVDGPDPVSVDDSVDDPDDDPNDGSNDS